MKSILPLVGLCLIPGGLRAADSFAAAEAVSAAELISASNASATREAGEPAESGERTLWYKYTTASKCIVRISTPGTASPNAIGVSAVLSAFQGTSLSALNLVDSANRYADGEETGAPNPGSIQVEFPAEAGMEFRISIGSVFAGESATMAFTVEERPWAYGNDPVTMPAVPASNTPGNDSFANATPINAPGGQAVVVGYNASATSSPSDPAESGPRSLWYSHTTKARGSVKISTVSGNMPGFRHRITVYQGESLSAINVVDTMESNLQGYADVNFTCEAGMKFRIQVSSISQDPPVGTSINAIRGPFAFTLTESGWVHGTGTVVVPAVPTELVPVNDEIGSATVLPGTVGVRRVVGYMYSATSSLLSPESGTGLQNVLWYRMTAADHVKVTLATPANYGVQVGHGFAVYEGSPPAALALVSKRTGSGSVKLEFNATKGKTYQIGFGSVNAQEWDNFVFTQSVELQPLPEIAVTEPSGTQLQAGKSKRPFGTAKVGKSGKSRTFTIHNTGTAPLTKLAVSGLGKNAADFVIGGLKVTSLAPGAKTTVKVTFRPKKKGNRVATLRITSNDADEARFDIGLSGAGAAK